MTGHSSMSVHNKNSQSPSRPRRPHQSTRLWWLGAERRTWTLFSWTSLLWLAACWLVPLWWAAPPSALYGPNLDHADSLLPPLRPSRKDSMMAVSGEKPPFNASPREPDGWWNGLPLYYQTGPPPPTRVTCLGNGGGGRTPRVDGQANIPAWMMTTCHYRHLCYDTARQDYVQHHLSPPDQVPGGADHIHHTVLSMGGINPRWMVGEGPDRGVDKIQWSPLLSSSWTGKVSYSTSSTTFSSSLANKKQLPPFYHETTTPRSGYYQLARPTVLIPFHSLAAHNVGHLLWDDLYPIFRVLRLWGWVVMQEEDDARPFASEAEWLLVRHRLGGYNQRTLYANCDIRLNKRQACADHLAQFVPRLFPWSTTRRRRPADSPTRRGAMVHPRTTPLATNTHPLLEFIKSHDDDGTITTTNKKEQGWDPLFPNSTMIHLNSRESDKVNASRIVCAPHAVVGLGLWTDHGWRDHGWTPPRGRDHSAAAAPGLDGALEEVVLPTPPHVTTNSEKKNATTVHDEGAETLVIPHNIGRGHEFWQFREFIVQNALFPIKPPGRQAVLLADPRRKSTFRVVFSMYSSRDWDRRLNFTNQIEVLKEALEDPKAEGQSQNNVEVQAVAMWKLSLEEQIQLASQTHIFLTACGGGSMTASFLPRGASLILFYSAAGGFSFESFRRTHQPARLDWDLLNNAAHLRVHWLPISTMDQPDDLELLVRLIEHELSVLSVTTGAFDI